MCDSMALQVAKFEKRVIASLHITEKLFRYKTVEFLLVAFKELWCAKTAGTTWDITWICLGCCVD